MARSSRAPEAWFVRVVVSQSMLFPWVGMLEQVRLADVFVHYDDVQLPDRGFNNRVQIKTPQGMRWMTVPLAAARRGICIDEVSVVAAAEWREKHLQLLERSFKGAPHAADALQLARRVYAASYSDLGALARTSMLALCDYFEIAGIVRFVDSRNLGVAGKGSERILLIAKELGASVYITGHGAARYLDHPAFDQNGVRVEYMKYLCLPYPQSHGPFTPYVSGLDLVAHCGRDGARYIQSNAIHWKEFLNGSK